MSIEKALADQTVAINENTAAVKALIAAMGASGKAASTSTASTSTPEKPPTKPNKTEKAGPDRAAVNAALTEVKEKKTAHDAKAIIKTVGGVDKMADIPEDKFQAVYDAAKKALAGDEATGDDDGI